MKTYDNNDLSIPKIGELFRIENQQGIFTAVENGSCSDCYFIGNRKGCINAPRCGTLGAFARVDENIADNPTQVKPKRKRPSRAFKITGEIKAGTQVSPNYKIVKPINSINELADVFENHKSVFNLTTRQIQNTAFVQNMQFSVILRFCKEGKIWIVEPVKDNINNPI